MDVISLSTMCCLQDKADDILVGVKSTALRLGDNTKPWLAGFTTFISAGLTATGYLCDQTWPFYLGVTYVTAHLAHQVIFFYFL
jgi:4-hydroxybenzoate polyprenyltransferase